MRSEFSEGLIRLAETNSRILLLTGDHGYALFDDFRTKYPSQYINAGIAEQNMVGMAAGLARTGFRPIVYGLSAFVPIRVIEQIKLDIAHDYLPVILIGDGAGFVYSSLGTSHQSTEDIACTRAIPGLAVFSPADRFELSMCLEHAYTRNGPAYVRIGKADRGDVHKSPISAGPQQLLSVRSGVKGGIVFIATGSMLQTAALIADAEFPGAAVWSAPSLKPIDVAQIVSICQSSMAIVTLEEHSVYGGLGSLISEVSCSSVPRPVLRIGVDDRFSEKCGSYDYLLSEHRLDRASVSTRIREFIAAQ